MDYSIAQAKLTEDIVKKHSIAIVIVCLMFGVLNIVRAKLFFGLIIFAFAVVILLISNVIMKKASIAARGTLLTQATALIIAILAGFNNELHAMFALMVGNIAIGSIYYSPKNIKMSWILTDVLLLAGLLLPDIMYEGASLELIAKGIVKIGEIANKISALVAEYGEIALAFIVENPGIAIGSAAVIALIIGAYYIRKKSRAKK